MLRYPHDAGRNEPCNRNLTTQPASSIPHPTIINWECLCVLVVKKTKNLCHTPQNLLFCPFGLIFRRFFGDFVMASLKPRVTVEYGEKATIVTFTDEKILEERDIVELQESLMGVIEQTEKINLILDFSTVKFLSSAVLGLLIRVSKKVYEQNGQLRLCNISPRIYEIFKITRLTKIFDILPDRASAAASLAEEH